MRQTLQTANQYHPQAACEARRAATLPEKLYFLSKTQVHLQTNTGHEAIGVKKKHNLEDKQAVPYGFQGLHLFFRVPLSGAERGESGGGNGEP